MFAARSARAVPRISHQLRAPAQRRFASGSSNEFINERQHIKEHAKGTTGTRETSGQTVYKKQINC